MAQPFCLVCEVGIGNNTIDRFADEAAARAVAKKKWCCWVLYRAAGAELTELSAGGVGFSHGAIRSYAETNIRSSARDVDARAAAAAAAEARFAKAPAQPKPSRPAPAGNDGKVDVSNPTAWE